MRWGTHPCSLVRDAYEQVCCADDFMRTGEHLTVEYTLGLAIPVMCGVRQFHFSMSHPLQTTYQRSIALEKLNIWGQIIRKIFLRWILATVWRREHKSSLHEANARRKLDLHLVLLVAYQVLPRLSDCESQILFENLIKARK